MFYHLLLTPLIALLSGLFALLPPWTITLGTGPGDGAIADGASTDGSLIYRLAQFIAPYDHFMPLHDFFIPCIGLALAIFVALFAFKGVKFILSLIPGISAGG